MKKLILILIITSIHVNASDLTIPNVFVAGTSAKASEVNTNFVAVKNSVNDNHSQIQSLITQINSLQATVSSLQSTVTQLQSDLTAVENNSVLELDGFLSHTVVDGYDVAEFKYVNVQILSGTGSSSSSNGRGNLIIGPHNAIPTAPFFCSDPQYTDSVNCIGNLETWAQNVRTGSHNLIIGVSHSYTNNDSIISGYRNVSNNRYTTVFGRDNIVQGYASNITGGWLNKIYGSHSSISGGVNNITNGSTASITGGENNTANGSKSHISGGRNNTAPTGSHWSTVSGGNTRTTTSLDDWVGGSLFEDN